MHKREFGNIFGIEELSSLAALSPKGVMGFQDTQDQIANLISGGAPFMVARFGSGELRAVWRWRIRKRASWSEIVYRELVRREKIIWSPRRHEALERVAGFFPLDAKSVGQFSEVMVSAMSEVDVFGSWVRGENEFASELHHAKTTQLGFLEPFFSPSPWTRALANKKVLVIHPFSNTILHQFARRQDLFDDPSILPDMDLTVLRAFQTAGGNRPEKLNWFGALERMAEKALEEEFDVALVGCGAYGFPLAAKLKREGRGVIHLGGMLQLLFGIKGYRWERERPDLGKLYNPSWIRPLDTDTPQNYQVIENASYW